MALEVKTGKTLRLELGDPLRVPPAFEICGQPDAHDAQRHFFRHHALAEGEDVGVVMLPRKPGGFFIPAEGATDTADFIGGHRLTVARAAEDNAALAFPARNRFGSRSNKFRVIDRLLTRSAEIHDLVA